MAFKNFFSGRTRWVVPNGQDIYIEWPIRARILIILARWKSWPHYKKLYDICMASSVSGEGEANLEL